MGGCFRAYWSGMMAGQLAPVSVTEDGARITRNNNVRNNSRLGSEKAKKPVPTIPSGRASESRRYRTAASVGASPATRSHPLTVDRERPTESAIACFDAPSSAIRNTVASSSASAAI